MVESQRTGARIRARRLDRGISQTELAHMAGISPPYLNLIEHNRRRIAGKVLHDIARALGLDASVLTEVAEPALLEALDLAAASEPASGAERTQTREFADRFPGWAATVAAQARRISGLEDRVAALSDRLAHDMQLDTSLHEVISVVTSIRSTASILVGADDIDADWQSRFHQNLHQDSVRLAEASQALATYLETPKTDAAATLSPVEEFERYLDETDHHVAQLEVELLPEDAIEAMVSALVPPQAKSVARDWFHRYRADTEALPMAVLAPAAVAAAYDPGAIAEAVGSPLPVVMRRLASLPPGEGHPPIGLAICDASGGLTYLKSNRDFALPRNAPACPIWPLYQALQQPGQPIRAVVSMPGAAAPRLTCYALASPDGPLRFDAPQHYRAMMLAVADAPLAAGLPVGRSCRVCPRAECAVRREPSILPRSGDSATSGL
ncbi:helix-turn-helix transcriptional regulator [Flavimaricola marinus]|uniref:Anaerobic benzoate catabolism transcriptional regulator n=1 Tax=Flavimaricola marinus TaxID=1819565 RepID=A0A238LJ47_9RHOB|nr:helix-turn-helix transcriptional regulator [Flavimaricola marinus]SMY09573.1 anaerobic benzoate catabolism transcriptional regulator [Flavimaricola marinus]